MTVIKRMVIIQTMKSKMSLFYGEKCMEALFLLFIYQNVTWITTRIQFFIFFFIFLYFSKDNNGKME